MFKERNSEHNLRHPRNISFYLDCSHQVKTSLFNFIMTFGGQIILCSGRLSWAVKDAQPSSPLTSSTIRGALPPMQLVLHIHFR